LLPGLTRAVSADVRIGANHDSPLLGVLIEGSAIDRSCLLQKGGAKFQFLDITTRLAKQGSRLVGKFVALFRRWKLGKSSPTFCSDFQSTHSESQPRTMRHNFALICTRGCDYDAGTD
jgi:hypothetical protein